MLLPESALQTFLLIAMAFIVIFIIFSLRNIYFSI